MEEAIYTTYEISRFLSVDITTVMSWIDAGKLAAYKTPGGHRRVLHQDMLNFLNKFKMPVPAELLKQNKRVLVVDDEPQIIRLVKRLLQKISDRLEIESASDGFEAGQKLEIFSPDLVILDLNLPGVDGFRVCKTIRANEKKRHVKILAISGKNTEENRKKILACGADAFMAKPFDLELFSDSVRRFLDIKPAN